MVAIKISEVNLVKDYVVLINNSDRAVNLRSWKILDTTQTNQKRHEFIFKKDFFLAPNSMVKIWSGIGNDDTNNVYQNRRAAIWNNPGDTAFLYDNFGDEVDKKTFGKPPGKGGRGPAPPKPTKITISGFVNDSVCGQGVKAHLVFESLKGQETIETDSDDDGNYKTELTTGRDYTAKVTAPDYDETDETINTKAGKDMNKDFKLNPRLEIELGVDSTEVKFTRKDDNKINATQELKDKLVVDFNSNYTFTVKLSITKGMTDKVKAILVEDSITNKDSRESNMCRISDNDKSITFTFNPIKQKWDWVVLGAFWYVDSEKTKANLEKSFNYALDLSGSYGSNNSFGPDVSFELGEIVVRVNGEKLVYLVQYDLLLDSMYRAIATASALTVAAAIPSPVSLALAAAAATAWAAATLLGMQKDSALASAKDPPQFDKNYKNLVKPKINLKTRNIKQRIYQLAYLRKSIFISRDRFYTAQLKNDKAAAEQQFKNLKLLLKIHNDNARFTQNYLVNAIKQLKKYKQYFTPSAIHKFRSALRTKTSLKSKILKSLKFMGLSEKDTRAIISAFVGKKLTDKNLSLAPCFNVIPKLVDNFNTLLVNDMEKEIKWCQQIKRQT